MSHSHFLATSLEIFEKHIKKGIATKIYMTLSFETLLAQKAKIFILQIAIRECEKFKLHEQQKPCLFRSIID